MKKIILSAIIATHTLFCLAQATSLNISTGIPGWTSSSSTTQTLFYGNNNWQSINSAQPYTTYTFKRVFYICKKGSYHFSLKGMGDNHMIVKLDNSTTLIDYDVTTASQFNKPATFEKPIELNCGKHELIVTVKNHTEISGYFLNAIIYSTGGALSNNECKCIEKKCCPKGWLATKTNIDGGETGEGERQCKKLSCKPMGVPPFPPNGTQLGNNIGFTWGDELWIYGNSQNGGEARDCK